MTSSFCGSFTLLFYLVFICLDQSLFFKFYYLNLIAILTFVTFFVSFYLLSLCLYISLPLSLTWHTSGLGQLYHTCMGPRRDSTRTQKPVQGFESGSCINLSFLLQDFPTWPPAREVIFQSTSRQVGFIMILELGLMKASS